jgi:RecA-family ATPase
MSEAVDFLQEYFRGVPGHIFLAGYRNPGSKLPKGESGKGIGITQVDMFLRDLDRPELENGIYFCTSTLRRGCYRREETSCEAWISIFADLDDKNHTLPRGKVIELLEGLPLPPTYIVDTGNGLHPHWLFDKPATDFAKVELLRLRLQKVLLPSDTVHDAVRVMRLVGSHNSKSGGWLPVQLTSNHPERRYSIDALAGWIEHSGVIIERAPVANPKKAKPKTESARGNQANGHDQAARGASDENWTYTPTGDEAVDKWGEKFHSILTGSEYHGSLRDVAAMLAMAGADGGTITNVLRGFMGCSIGERDDRWEDRFLEDIDESVDSGIEKAKEWRQEKKQTEQAQQQPPPGDSRGQQQGQQQTLPPPPSFEWVDISAWDARSVPERQWAIFDRSPLNQAGLFSGHGGTGKSILELTKDVAHVITGDWLGSMPEPGGAFYIGCEDEEDEIHRRLADIIRHYNEIRAANNLPPLTFEQLAKDGLRVRCLLGQDAVLCAAKKKSGTVEATTLYRRLYQQAGDLKPNNISIDTLSRAFAGNEIDRVEVYGFANHMQALAMVARASVTVLSHPSLTGMRDGTGISGSTAWHNAFRFRHYLTTPKAEGEEAPDTSLREVKFLKNQYGTLGQNMVLEYRSGLFLPVAGTVNMSAAMRASKAEQVFMELLDRLTRQNTIVNDKTAANNYAPTVFAREKETKEPRIKKADLEEAMRTLLRTGKITNEPYGPPSRGFTRLVRA